MWLHSQGPPSGVHQEENIKQSKGKQWSKEYAARAKFQRNDNNGPKYEKKILSC
jgi:hypothetical protein